MKLIPLVKFQGFQNFLCDFGEGYLFLYQKKSPVLNIFRKEKYKSKDN